MLFKAKHVETSDIVQPCNHLSLEHWLQSNWKKCRIQANRRGTWSTWSMHCETLRGSKGSKTHNATGCYRNWMELDDFWWCRCFVAKSFRERLRHSVSVAKLATHRCRWEAPGFCRPNGDWLLISLDPGSNPSNTFESCWVLKPLQSSLISDLHALSIPFSQTCDLPLHEPCFGLWLTNTVSQVQFWAPNDT